MDQVTTKQVLVTPEMAYTFLKFNRRDNRPISEGRVQALSGMIRRGVWKLTHQGIAFDRDGLLLDGQHRLAAIVRAGIPVPMLVTRGLSPDAFLATDDVDPRRPYFRSDIGNHPEFPSRDPMRDAAACVIIHTIKGGSSRKPAADQIAGIYSWAGRAMAAIHNSCHVNAKARSTAPVRAACVCRMLTGSADDWGYALKVWRGFCAMELDLLPRVAGSLISQIDKGEVGSRANPLDFAARAWVLFNPAQANISRIVIKDKDSILREMRGVLQAAEERAGRVTT